MNEQRTRATPSAPRIRLRWNRFRSGLPSGLLRAALTSRTLIYLCTSLHIYGRSLVVDTFCTEDDCELRVLQRSKVMTAGCAGQWRLVQMYVTCVWKWILAAVDLPILYWASSSRATRALRRELRCQVE